MRVIEFDTLQIIGMACISWSNYNGYNLSRLFEPHDKIILCFTNAVPFNKLVDKNFTTLYPVEFNSDFASIVGRVS